MELLHVLIADDHPVVRAGLRALLEAGEAEEPDRDQGPEADQDPDAAGPGDDPGDRPR